MKKFLSLVLALVMTMSLVTISAGATEYKDLTDKDEIQYEEAVAVLNRIGIITGYEDGTFRPETELTRGAAAKIIVSLMIGPEAANALPNTASPYPDVPAGHTFAGVIGYCKTAGYISGYGDGTFKPANSLTGYAFAKMLLGALGYKSEVEGFTGTGWTMNVARLGNEANLFNRLNFDGAASVNREQACQLALNTLKATMVEYTGGVNISTASGDTMTVNPTRTYKTSNQDYAANISNRKLNTTGNADVANHYTVEFGEEHFKDLRLDNEHQGKLDDFGRPSNVWSFKKVTIGTFPIEPDFTYTTQVAHNVAGTTDASKVRALGLNGYEVTGDVGGRNASTILTINGLDGDDADVKDISTVTGGINKVADIADLTDNGTLVEVYVSEDDADFICNVVVVKTQLMEIKRIGSDYVALDTVDADDPAFGYNDKPIDEKLEDVEVDDNYYNTLHEMKAGDLVAVVPLTTDGGATWTVGKAYAPEEAKGSLTRVDTYGDTNNPRKAISVTVGGTEYKIAQWNKDLTGIDGDSIRVTKKDVTLILDEYGNALQAKDVGDTSNWMVVKNYRQSLVNGSIVNIVNGWDIGGDTLSLNVGVIDYRLERNGDIQPGDLVYYSNNTNSNTAEWKLSKDNAQGVFDIDAEANGVGTDTYEIKASNTSIALDGYAEMPLTTGTSDRVVIDTGIKFIYVSFDEDGEVDNIEFVNGVKDTKNEEILGGDKSAALNKNAQACVSLKDHKASGQKDKVTDDSAVKAVVIKRESSDASIGNLLYISNYHGSATKYDNDNRPVYGYEAIMMGSDGKVADEKAIVYSYKNLRIGEFARYTKVTAPEGVTGVDDNFYDLRGYGIDSNKDTWGRSAAIAATQLVRCLSQDKRLVMTSGVYGNTRAIDLPDLAQDWNDKDSLNLGDTSAANLINTRGSSWVDLRNVKDRIEDIDDLKDWLKDNPGKAVNVALLFNDNIDSNDFRHAYLIVITGTGNAPSASGAVNPSVDGAFTPLASAQVGSTYTVTLNDGYSYDASANVNVSDVTVTGKTISFKVTGLPATIGVSKDTETKTLTITGELAAATDLYVFAGDTLLTGTEKVTAADGKVMEYKVPANAKVTIRSASIDVADGTYTMADAAKTKVTVVTTGVAEIAAMTADAVVGGLKAGGANPVERTYTITVEDGMTLSDFTNVGGSVDDADAVQSKDGNVYTMKASANITGFKVKIDSTKNEATYAFVSEVNADGTAKVNNYNLTNNAAQATADECVTTARPVTTPNPNHNVMVIGGHKVTMTSINPGCFGFWGNVNDAFVIQRGYAIPVSIDIDEDGASAAIWMASGAKKYAADRVHNGFKIEDDGALVAAVKVELGDATAQIDSDTKTGTLYVKTGETISSIALAGGGSVIDAANGQTYGAAVTSVSTIAKDVKIVPATAVTGASGISIRTVSPVTGGEVEVSNSATPVYVVPGTTLNLYGASGQTLAVTATSGGAAITEGVTIAGNSGTFKVGTVAATISQS